MGSYKFLWFLAILAGSIVQTDAAVLEIAPDGTITVYNGPPQSDGKLGRPIAAPATSVRVARISTEMAAHFKQAGKRAQLSPALVAAVAWTESRLQATARSPKGALGVMQLMPGTAALLGVNARDTAQNVQGGAIYLRAMLERFGGDLPLALAAYNAGPETVRRYGGIPPYRETQAYVASVLERLAEVAESTQEAQP